MGEVRPRFACFSLPFARYSLLKRRGPNGRPLRLRLVGSSWRRGLAPIVQSRPLFLALQTNRRPGFSHVARSDESGSLLVYPVFAKRFARQPAQPFPSYSQRLVRAALQPSRRSSACATNRRSFATTPFPSHAKKGFPSPEKKDGKPAVPPLLSLPSGKLAFAVRKQRRHTTPLRGQQAETPSIPCPLVTDGRPAGAYALRATRGSRRSPNASVRLLGSPFGMPSAPVRTLHRLSDAFAMLTPLLHRTNPYDKFSGLYHA